MIKIGYSGINKKNVIIVFGVVFIIIAGILSYALIFDDEHQKQSSDNSNMVKPNNINVTVTNIINDLPSINASEAKQLPPLDVNVPPIINNGDMERPPIVERIQPIKSTPKMLVIGNEVGGADDRANAISNTNSKIGTGEIASKLIKQRSPYTIFAGTFIPAILTTGINSDLNGEIVGRIRNNVYDSTHGKYLLIPQGSRIIGTYNHEIAYGQNRLMVGWNRVIYPNGTSLVLHGQPGTDLSGYSGFSDSVDNHYAKIFGSAFIMGLIFGGTTVATGNQGTNPFQLSAGATIATQVGAQMGQAGVQIIQKGINIPPTVMISPGYKFNILLTADLVLKPYIFR